MKKFTTELGGYAHAVLDVAVFEDYTLDIIEINPFGKMASAGLYSWVIDQKILYGESLCPIDIRLKEWFTLSRLFFITYT